MTQLLHETIVTTNGRRTEEFYSLKMMLLSNGGNALQPFLTGRICGATCTRVARLSWSRKGFSAVGLGADSLRREKPHGFNSSPRLAS